MNEQFFIQIHRFFYITYLSSNRKHLLTFYVTINTHDKKSISVNTHVYLDPLVATSKKHTSFLKTIVKYMTKYRKC